MHDSILLVGNGPSALKFKAGSIINNIPLVCRFNSFKIIGYEEYVGTKSDIWVTCLGKKHTMKRQHMFSEIYYPLLQKNYIELCKVIPNSKCFSPEVYEEASMLNGKYFYPSSGLMATVFFINKGYDVLLHGFDFFQGNVHHYCDSQKMGNNHSPENELLAFDKLFKENKVRFLIK